MSIYPRTEYEMTEADLERILDACKPVPMIMLHIGTPSSPQENANRAWAELGNRMGFDAMTVQPIPSKGTRFFTAIPSETPSQREERVVAEKLQAKNGRIAELKSTIANAQTELEEISK
jgi:hypothetical protein